MFEKNILFCIFYLDPNMTLTFTKSYLEILGHLIILSCKTLLDTYAYVTISRLTCTLHIAISTAVKLSIAQLLPLSFDFSVVLKAIDTWFSALQSPASPAMNAEDCMFLSCTDASQ